MTGQNWLILLLNFNYRPSQTELGTRKSPVSGGISSKKETKRNFIYLFMDLSCYMLGLLLGVKPKTRH